MQKIKFCAIVVPLFLVFNLFASPSNASNKILLPTVSEQEKALLTKPSNFAQLKLELKRYRKEISRNPKKARALFQEMETLDLRANHELQRIKERTYRYYGFYITDVDVDRRQEKPRICVDFTRQVRPEPMQKWQQFIKAEPAISAKWQYQGDQLCFDGDWQTQYTINVDQYLESNNRLPLYKAPQKRVFTVNSGIRYPMVRFTSHASVLDIKRSSLIPIQLSNMSKASVKLWRIPANNLSNARVRELINNTQSQWGVDSLLSDNAESIYSGEFETPNFPLNKTITRNIDIKNIAPQAEAGVYVLKVMDADSDDYAKDIAIKVFMLSTDGMSAYVTPDGLWVELRSLENAQINVTKELILYAKDNQILGKAKTDRKGIAYFPKEMLKGKDGAEPSHLVYETPTTLAYLSLIGAGIDLSTKGLAGERSDNTLNAWIWQDRGVYRQNDNVHLLWLLKDKQGNAFTKAPVWINILRPDGRSVLKKAIQADKSGSYRIDYHFANNAWLGDWRVRLSLAKDGSGFIKQQVIPVSAVQPQQIGITLKADQKKLHIGDKALFTLNANWLYGAPSVDLTGRAEWIYLTDSLGDKYADYQIGIFDQELMLKHERKKIEKTDAQGESKITLMLDDVPFSTKPLMLRLNTSVTTPSGQSIANQYTQRVTRKQDYIAVKVEDKSARIALIDDSEVLHSATLKWKLYRRHFNYYWYRTQDNGWHYQSNENRTLVHQGEVQTNTKQASILELPLDDGRWVLEVRGDAQETVTSMPIEYGAYTSHKLQQSPDLIQITTDKERYQVGEQVKIHLTAPFDGPASIKLAQDGILSNRVFKFKNGKADQIVAWDKSWDKGVWLLVSAWNEDQQQATHKRAVGLTWLGGDLKPYSIPLTVKLDKKIKPKQKISIPLSIPKKLAKGKVWAQVAVIDDALYQLTAPSFTSPLDTFMGKKQLPLTMYDVWGRIITPREARKVAIRQGSGAALFARNKLAEMADGNSVPDPEVTLDLDLYTYWSEPVSFDKQGKAQVSFDVPDTNTQFRVMALAWNNKRVGRQETTFKVKSPLVTQLYMAPFLTEKDQANIKIRLNNTSTQEMQLTLDVTNNKLLSISETQQKVTLKPGEVKWFSMPFIAKKAGHAEVLLTVSGSENFTQKHNVDIRSLSALTLDRKVDIVKPKDTMTIKPLNHVERVTLTAFAHAPINVEKLVEHLNYYPYGGVEQNVSKAWNNLLYPKLDIQQNLVTSSQTSLVNSQAYNGSFSLWQNSDTDIWLSAYVTDYLLALKEAELLDSAFMLNSVLNYLRSVVFNRAPDSLDSAISYAHRVLAQSGASTQGALLRYIEGLNTKPQLAPAALDAALALIYHGEIERSAVLLAKIVQAQIVTSPMHYGSYLRDIAQAMVLNHQIEREIKRLDIRSQTLQASVDEIEMRLWTALSSALLQANYSTQEIHWLTMLTKNIPNIAGKEKGRVLLNNKTVSVEEGTQLYKTNHVDKMKPQHLTNQGLSAVYLITDSWLRPVAQLEKEASIEMTYLDAYTGEEIDLNKIKHNQLIAIRAYIEVDKAQAQSRHNMIFNYPLPVGFTAVNMTYSARSNYLNRLKLKNSYANVEQDRDATHIAAFTTYKNQQDIEHVFFVRASRVGDWYAPSYQVQDMYNPNLQAKYQGVHIVVIDE